MSPSHESLDDRIETLRAFISISGALNALAPQNPEFSKKIRELDDLIGKMIERLDKDVENG